VTNATMRLSAAWTNEEGMMNREQPVLALIRLHLEQEHTPQSSRIPSLPL
jgi:hypothetical protein